MKGGRQTIFESFRKATAESLPILIAPILTARDENVIADAADPFIMELHFPRGNPLLGADDPEYLGYLLRKIFLEGVFVAASRFTDLAGSEARGIGDDQSVGEERDGAGNFDPADALWRDSALTGRQFSEHTMDVIRTWAFPCRALDALAVIGNNSEGFAIMEFDGGRGEWAVSPRCEIAAEERVEERGLAHVAQAHKGQHITTFAEPPVQVEQDYTALFQRVLDFSVLMKSFRGLDQSEEIRDDAP